jgi:hypothetical protein
MSVQDGHPIGRLATLCMSQAGPGSGTGLMGEAYPVGCGTSLVGADRQQP